MHSFAPYGIRVRDASLAGSKKDRFHRLNDVRGKDLILELKEFCDSHAKSYHTVEEEKSKKAIKFSNITISGRELYGFIESGDWGLKGKVVDIDKGSTVYEKKAKDSDVHQLYFHFLVPKERTNAICVFHNIHGRGVKGIFGRLFNERFRTSTKGLVIQMQPLSYEKVVNEWMKSAVVKELRLQKYTPKDELKDAASKLKEYVTNVTLKPKNKGESFGAFLDFYKGNGIRGSKRGAVEIMGEMCHSVKAVVEHEGRKRVFSLAANSTPVSNIEFDEEDVAMDDGAPSLESLKAYTSTLLADLIKTT